MIKTFCDSCGDETTKSTLVTKLSGLQVNTKESNLHVEVHIGDGDFCKYCVVDAVNTLDDRLDNINAKDMYNDLLFAVVNKVSGSTRHETALKYITQGEQRTARTKEEESES